MAIFIFDVSWLDLSKKQNKKKKNLDLLHQNPPSQHVHHWPVSWDSQMIPLYRGFLYTEYVVFCLEPAVSWILQAVSCSDVEYEDLQELKQAANWIMGQAIETKR